uniref:FAD-binding domain-containing protein n=1 Tax=Fusarium oxysporum (strain Fo5176) TaxID=660025 RepID=A0A0C4DIA6_FUSOF
MARGQKEFRVVIIGGGIAGIVLAISLLKRNIPCKIYERAHTFSDIGAGLGISPNAQDAMVACDPSVHNAFKKVASGNVWESKKSFVFEFLDGMDTATTDSPLFDIENRTGLQGCHRGSFVNELLKLLPSDVVDFNKQLQAVEEGNTGRIRLVFQDGAMEEADAVVGCDGIKSKVREILVGADHPSSKCSYTHKYAYRGMIPMRQAVEVLGEERALNATIWMGKDKHLLSYPVAHGTILNVVAYCSSSDEWPSESQLVLAATKEDLLRDFEGFRPSVLKVLDHTERLDRGTIQFRALQRDVYASSEMQHMRHPHIMEREQLYVLKMLLCWLPYCHMKESG